MIDDIGYTLSREFGMPLKGEHAVVDGVGAYGTESATAKEFGAFDPTAFGGKGSPLPVGFLIDPAGVLRHASRPDDVASFLDPRDVLRVLATEAPTAAGAGV